MTDFLHLNDGVGPGEANRPDDIQETTKRLTELTFEPLDRRAGLSDTPHSQIEAFQTDNGLTVDSVMKPGGETEQKVNIELRKKRDRDRRTLGGMLGDPDIENPVGARGQGPRNRRQDLVKAADTLDKAGQPPRITSGATSTQRANNVAAALRKFQRNAGLKADGVMNPGGPTQAALRDKLAENGLAAPPAEVLRRAEAGREERRPDQAGESGERRTPAPRTRANDIARDVAELSLFERDGILQAAGLAYQPDAMGRIGQGDWLDAEGRAIDASRVRAILRDAVARRHRIQPGMDSGAARAAAKQELMRRAGFRYDAGRGLWAGDDGATLTGTEAETALELARRQADEVLQGRASLDGLRAGRSGFAPAVAAPLAVLGGAGGLVLVVVAAIALKLTLEALEKNRRKQSRSLPTTPPPRAGREALPEKDRKPEPLKGPDPGNPPKVPNAPPGRPVLPPDMPPTPGFEPAELDNFIEIFPNDRDRLPQFFIVENRRGSQTTQNLNARIVGILLGSADRAGVRITHHAGGRDKDGIDVKERLLISDRKLRDGTIRGGSFPDLWFIIEGTSRRLLINTVDTRKSGHLTGREERGADRLFENAETGDLILTIPKLRPGEEINDELATEYFDAVLRRLNRPGGRKQREHFEPPRTR